MTSSITMTNGTVSGFIMSTNASSSSMIIQNAQVNVGNPYMSRNTIRLHPCSFHKSYNIKEAYKIKDLECLQGKRYFYYIKNKFAPDTYSSTLELYAFEIVKETPCFYFLINKQRLRKDTNHRRLDIAPSGALSKSIKRASIYLKILMDKARDVNLFLGTLNDANENRQMRDLKGFEAFIKQLEPDEPIPPDAYLDMVTQTKDLAY